VLDKTDCDDTKASVHPGATETCNGIDDNCTGGIDEGVKNSYYPDVDKDGFGDKNATATQACSAPTGYVTNNTDCNDSSAAVYPGATETCNGIDDNCNGTADEGLTTTAYYVDGDGDGYGKAGSTATQACSKPVGYVANNTDCDDTKATVNPGATEICNGIDDNCAGGIDEGVKTTFYQDSDGDGYGNASVSTSACSKPTGYVTDSTDCDDAKATVHPGATEACNGVDDNCNGTIDEGAAPQTWYQDSDADGYGNAAVTKSACI
jgi:hypothetical protein